MIILTGGSVEVNDLEYMYYDHGLQTLFCCCFLELRNQKVKLACSFLTDVVTDSVVRWCSVGVENMSSWCFVDC